MKRAPAFLLLLCLSCAGTLPVSLETWSSLEPGANIGTYQDPNGSKVEFTLVEGPTEGSRSLRIASELAPGGYCGVWHNLGDVDLSKNDSLRFMARSDNPAEVQVALGDAHHVQYVAKFKAPVGDWAQVRIPFASFIVNPDYTPPEAVLGHPMDLSRVSGLNFQPLRTGATVLWVGPVEGAGKPWKAPVPSGGKAKAKTEPAGPLEAIKVDQAGYLPDLPKIAFVTSDKAKGPFSVLRVSDGRPVFVGRLGPAVEDIDSGDRVRPADFSTFSETGDYRIRVEGVGESHPFRVAPDVYVDAYYLAMRSYYGQRCGTKVDLSPRFPQYHHEACHLEDGVFHASSGKRGTKNSLKGWHDAGDFGKYIVNSGITVGTLLSAWERFADRIGSIGLDLPESGDAVPDFLDEVKWNLDWMLTMQDEDGGVWHKLTTERFAGFVMPENSTAIRYFVGTGKEPYKNTTATADFAAVMAAAARIYKPYFPDYSRQCLKAAEKAWGWSLKNPEVTFSNPSGVGTGGYGDGHCGDEILWAAAELFRTTGTKEYDAYFRDHFEAYPISPNNPAAWPQVGNLALWTYYFSGRKEADPGTRESIRNGTLAAARAIVERSAKQGYRHSMTASNYIWGSNSVAANYGILLLTAHAMEPDPAFRATAMADLHYLLGCNPLGISYVTHVGTRYPMHPHHRPSGADGVEAPWPGLIAGGPNARPQDPAMRRMGPVPPARSYIDDQESYASNEIAINWNAPLVHLLAATLPSKKD